MDITCDFVEILKIVRKSTYKVLSDFIFNFQDWDFQYTIPARWSEYRARIPEYFHYDKYMQGYISLEVREETSAPNSITITSKERSEGKVTQTQFYNDKVDFQENRFRWATKDVPAFKEEPFMTTYKDYISKINFELAFTKFPNQAIKNYMGSWQDINNSYVENENFGGEIKGNGHLKQKVAELISGKESPEEKITAIHQYVRDNILWDGVTRKFVNTSLRKVMEEKKGNSAEVNLLMASMLEKAEIEVYAVLISTRDNGFVREALPISSQFNNVICKVMVGDKQILLDATQKLLPIGVLPERCLNGQGLVISKNGYSWVPLTTPTKSRTLTSADLTLSDGGDFSGKISIDRTGYFAERERRKYISKGEVEYIKSFIGSRPWQVSKSNFENTNQLSASLKENHEINIGEHSTVAGDLIYFNPFFLYRVEENPFKSEAREYPVDFGSPFDHVHFIKITIPAGYAIEELPAAKAVALTNNSGKFLFNVTQNNGIITVTSNVQINKGLFAQTEYQSLREFYAQVVAKQAEQIILKKKK